MESNNIEEKCSGRYETITEEQIKKLNEDLKPKATKDKMKWGIKTFKEWHAKRFKNNPFPDILAVYNDVDEMSASDVNYCLKLFVHEVRKVNNERYNPESLRGLFLAIQSYYRFQLGKDWNFLTDKIFKEARDALDTAMKMCSKEAQTSRKSQPISEDIEELLWEKGYLGDNTPKVLQRTLCYLLGVHLGLRGGDEQRCLEFGKQLKLQSTIDGEVLVYCDFGSKTNNGGLFHRKRNKRENVIIYPNQLYPNRCPVNLYKKYVSLRPKHCTTTAFYLKPLDKYEAGHWYANVPVGRNTLYSTIKNMMEAANIEGVYTNHSCRKTTGSRLHNAGFSEADIQSVTGHSSNSVREYISIEDNRKREMSEKLSISNPPQNMNENSVKPTPTVRLSKKDIVVELFLD